MSIPPPDVRRPAGHRPRYNRDAVNCRSCFRRPRRPLSARRLLLTALALVLLLAGCAVPLGPGFEIQRQQVTFEHAGGERAQVRGVYRIRNTGTSPLEQIELLLPPGLTEFRGTVNGLAGNVQLTESGDVAGVAPWEGLERAKAVARFTPPVGMKHRFELVVEYSVTLCVRDGSDSIYLPPERWFPELARPAALFARGRARGEDVRLAIRVPEGWRVLAPGRSERFRRGEHRFRVRAEDPEPHVLAGRYAEQSVRAHGQTVVFWTLSPLDSSVAQTTGAQLAQTVEFFHATLGPREAKGRPQVYVIEQHRPNHWGREDLQHAHFVDDEILPPAVSIFQRRTPGMEFGNESFRVAAEADLATTWFVHVARPESGKELRLAAALSFHFTRLAAETRGEDLSVRENVHGLIGKFDELLGVARAIGDSGPRAEEALSPWKQILFVIALEDRLGREKLNAGLRRMIQARRGDTWNRNDLRAALEMESGQDLAEFFRQWLNHEDIPDDFRARYTGTKEK
jgi:hypothetical protein